MTSADERTRRRGYEFFAEGLKEALFRSCLNYGLLAGGFTDPLVEIVVHAVEFYAASREAQGAAGNLLRGCSTATPEQWQPGLKLSPNAVLRIWISVHRIDDAFSADRVQKGGSMSTSATVIQRMEEDRVSNVLKWVLLAVAVVTFGLLAWATDVSYRTAPPQPDRFTGPDGAVLMTAKGIGDGKASFQRADLMDYGSIYGMGSYFGEDYTAEYLLRLGELTRDNIAQARFAKTFAALGEVEQSAVTAAMQRELKEVDLSGGETHLSAALAAAVTTLKAEIAQELLRHDCIKGWTEAYSLDPTSAANTAEFIIYSALTTVARRPGSDVSWTQNWPYEPLVGNAPTSSTFLWTWISFCFTFFCFGVVLFTYHR